MHDLAGRMNTGIGTPRAHRLQLVIGNLCQCLFQATLHSPAGVLALPATETRTIVFNTQGYSHTDCRCRERLVIETERKIRWIYRPARKPIRTASSSGISH